MVEVRIPELPPEKAEKLAKLLEKLADNSDSLIETLETLTKLKETGLLAGLSALAESFEEGFNYLMRPELMGSIGNTMMLLYLMSRIDHTMLFEISNKLPNCISKAYEQLKNPPEKKPGLIETINLLRSPEIYSMLNTLRTIISCIQDKQR